MAEHDWDPVDGFAFNIRTNIIHIIVSDFFKKTIYNTKCKANLFFLSCPCTYTDTNTYKHVYAYVDTYTLLSIFLLILS